MLVKTEDIIYTPFYCEENIYNLARTIAEKNPAAINSTYAVFLSNPQQTVPVWFMRLNKDRPGYPVIWDYHVFLVHKTTLGSYVYDFDTTLPFPVAFAAHYEATFAPEVELPKRFHRLFRIIPAVEYLKHFASDRSHMFITAGTEGHLPIATEEGEVEITHAVAATHQHVSPDDPSRYKQPPPPYRAIFTSEHTNNLQSYIDMQEEHTGEFDPRYGKVVDEPGYYRLFSILE